MLAYAASRPRSGARHSSPNAMLAIVALHVGALAVLMSAKMDLPQRIIDPGTEVTFVPTPQPPPPNPPVRQSQPRQSTFTQPQQQIPLPSLDQPTVDPAPSLPTSRRGPVPASTRRRVPILCHRCALARVSSLRRRS